MNYSLAKIEYVGIAPLRCCRHRLNGAHKRPKCSTAAPTLDFQSLTTNSAPPDRLIKLFRGLGKPDYILAKAALALAAICSALRSCLCVASDH